jgi:broad specificity phosphatase PhoE
MVRIVLIRPGATDFDEQHRIRGNLDVPLNQEGSVEVARLIEELRDQKLELIYTAPEQSAVETAEALADALLLKVKKLDRVQNLDFGLWQGMAVDEIRLNQPKVYRQWQEMPQNVRPPEGEMLSEADERVRAAMTKLLKRHKEGVIALVVAEPLASLVKQFVTQTELGDLWKAAAEHGRWEMLEVVAEALAEPS